MDVAEAFSLISRAVDVGRLASGYLLVGDLAGGCRELMRKILEKLFPEEKEQIAAQCHPDVSWLEPEGVKRIIKVESMRSRIVTPMGLASYSGGWKVGVVVGADRMEAPSANAFLKSLEEPTPKTLYLLLTDQPDAILPTILSRVQRIDLPRHRGVFDGEVRDAIAAAFLRKDVTALLAVLDEQKKAVEDEEVGLVRKRFFRTLVEEARKVMLSGKVPRYRAFRNIEAIEEAYRQVVERSMGEEMVLAFMLDRLVLESNA